MAEGHALQSWTIRTPQVTLKWHGGYAPWRPNRSRDEREEKWRRFMPRSMSRGGWDGILHGSKRFLHPPLLHRTSCHCHT